MWLGANPKNFTSQPFVTSWLLRSYALASIRVFMSVYCFFTIFFSWAWFAKHEVVFHLQDIAIPKMTFMMGVNAIGRSFSYFTYLSYWGLAFYFAFAGMHTFVFAKRGTTWLDNWPVLMKLLHSILYSSIVCYPFLVSSIYWGSMWVGPSWFKTHFDSWSMISIHVLNSLFATFELVVTQTPPLPWLQMSALLLIMGLYLGIAYLSKVTAGVYVYLWLDPKVGADKIIAHIIGYTMAIIVIFTLVRGAIWLRCRLTQARTLTLGPEFERSESDNSSSHATFWTSPEIEMQKPELSSTTLEVSTNLSDSRKPSLEAPTIPRMSFDASSIDPTELPQPEQAYRQHPLRSSNSHFQNFSRPHSVATIMSKSTRQSGFWA